MDTSALRSFAVASRVGLLRDVSARLVGVLAPGSPERVEAPGVVASLEAAIAAAGGGEVGRAAVVDRVAYTWFNRVVALRFMDANGFTAVGVVSPPAGESIGQPEVLADAKAGQMDADVVSARGRELIQGLLSGSRKSSDAQGEAYGVLLAEYCRHWNRVMPFMFERAGDFTELLIPSNLLAPESILAKANEVMTAEVCADVEVIGWLYQFYISERKDDVFAGFKKGKKAGAAEIPAATQLFTPDWIVRYLVENSLGRLWLLNYPNSRLAEQMDYYIAPVDEETDFLKISSPEELNIVDPACGSGHMLTYAFDLLYAIYEEAGYAPADIPGLILSKNLYGVEIDQRAGSLAAFALTMKARARQRTFFTKDVQPNICVLQNVHFTPEELDELVTRGGDRFAEEDFWQAFQHADTFGSLIQPDETLLQSLRMHVDQVTKTDQLFTQDLYTRAECVLTQAEYLSQRYHVVVANPPYMTLRNMEGNLAAYVKEYFDESASDLFATFISRSLLLGVSRALVSMITMQTWMFGSSFGPLRARLVHESRIRSMAHLGTSAFDSIGGAVVSTTAFVIEKGRGTGGFGTFIDLTSYPNEAEKSGALIEAASGIHLTHSVNSETFGSIPGMPIAYWVSPIAVETFRTAPALSSIAEFKAGISTGDNSRFERLWHEVSSRDIGAIGSVVGVGKSRWTPCNSGGRFRRWYGNNGVVMDWENDGERIKAWPGSAIRNPSFMGRSGITYSKVGGANFAARAFESGFTFDDAGRGIFTCDRETDLVIAGLLNSTVGKYYLDLMSPGLNFTSTEIGNVPWLEVDVSRMNQLVDRAISISKNDWNTLESARAFEQNQLLVHKEASSIEFRYEALQAENSQLVEEMSAIELEIDQCFAHAYDLFDICVADRSDVYASLWANAHHRYGTEATSAGIEHQVRKTAMEELLSYAVGCMCGRYSLDVPGLVLADQGDTLQEYLAKVPNPSFMPDADNVIPIVDGDWFEDDIVGRFREFLRVAFGEEHFEENLRFVTESLGVKDLRDYFVKSFYKDHVQRYKKRPIYWLFSSPKGSFNALIYMHRYSSSTVSTVLNEYLREYKVKLSASLQHHERLAVGAASAKEQAAAAKEADRLRKVILELDEYEHDVLYPLASQQIAIDLDDGVKVNYPKFGAALKKIPGLETNDE